MPCTKTQEAASFYINTTDTHTHTLLYPAASSLTTFRILSLVSPTSHRPTVLSRSSSQNFLFRSFFFLLFNLHFTAISSFEPLKNSCSAFVPARTHIPKLYNFYLPLPVPASNSVSRASTVSQAAGLFMPRFTPP